MRTFREIALEIKQKWTKISPYAAQYLETMESLNTTDKNTHYFYDSAESVVLYFLANAQGFRGEDAKRIKAELKSMLNN